MVVSLAVCAQRLFRIVGRSFLAFVLVPETPIADWLDELDDWLGRSKGFFDDRPAIVDFSHVALTQAETLELLAQLRARGLRIIGVEGVDTAWVGPQLGPLPGGSKSTGVIELPDDCGSDRNATAEQADPQPTALLLDGSVRSGQSIVFPNGDITVAGSVASGAELVAGGSIHVYGCLRGRALAGSYGNTHARIFCSSFEAELLAIGGLYKTADLMEPDLRGCAIQARLDGEVLVTTVQS